MELFSGVIKSFMQAILLFFRRNISSKYQTITSVKKRTLYLSSVSVKECAHSEFLNAIQPFFAVSVSVLTAFVRVKCMHAQLVHSENKNRYVAFQYVSRRQFGPLPAVATLCLYAFAPVEEIPMPNEYINVSTLLLICEETFSLFIPLE